MTNRTASSLSASSGRAPRRSGRWYGPASSWLPRRAPATRQIAADLRIRPDTVRKWRGRFAVAGLAGLVDAKRSGRPRRYGAEQRMQVVATAAPPYPESTWSHRRIAAQLPELGISASQVGRILAVCDLRPLPGPGLADLQG
ncbi:helix-turn-helix domain-containing protein [Dactylosporangium sp. CA-233914]|uniref:helix-turn-helix domain-containing protein n=1 Tax=Dactylosporangium sp. CA-233914 TaxID=3239934 RepID=UPI003D89BB61